MDSRALIMRHPGARICVMGGAPSLDEHLKQMDADVYISVNAHGSHHRHDYIVAMDEDHGNLGVPMMGYLRDKSKAPIIGPRHWNDYVLTTWPDCPKTNILSGMLAAWVAWTMGAKVVILAGMDGYGGSASGMAHCSPIARDVKCPIRVVGGGPLTKFWPAYDVNETFGDYKMHPTIETLQGIDGMTRIRALKKCSTPGLALNPGDEANVMRHQAFRLLKHRLVEEIEKPADGDKANTDAALRPDSAKTGESADLNGDGKVTVAELKAALTEAGVKFDARWNKDKIAALWAAFQRWGGDAEVWNNLADDDKAARMAGAD